MTRITRSLLVQRVEDDAVVMDESTGEEVQIPGSAVQDVIVALYGMFSASVDASEPPAADVRLDVPVVVDGGAVVLTGFRQDWITGGDDAVRFELSSGAGLGNPWMTLVVREGGRSQYERVDMRGLAQDWVTSARARLAERP